MLVRRLRAAARACSGDVASPLADALRAAGTPVPPLAMSGPVALSVWTISLSGDAAVVGAAAPAADVDRLVVELFEQEGHSLVRLVRLFVDDRNAAEDLVQEAFIRLVRSAGQIHDADRAAAYLRSIVLNLARDHNRRGLVSLRHRLPFDDRRASVEDEITVRDDQRQVIDALRDLAPRQRDCLVLRYFHELGIDDIATTLHLSPNSVKTHLKRGLAAMERRLGEHRPTVPANSTAPEDEVAGR